MKKLLTLTAVFGLVCAGLLTGCNKDSSTTPSAGSDMPATNSVPAAPTAPATPAH